MTRVLLIALVALPVVAAPVPKENDAARMVRIYGTRADPKDDAKYEMQSDALRVLSPARELPPPEVRGERPTPEQRELSSWKPTPDGGSRVCREVSGDFTATVRVSFRLRPAPAPAPGVRWLPRAAGLVAWSGDNDHVGIARFESLSRGAAPGGLQVRDGFQSILTHPRGVRIASGSPEDQADAGYVRLKRAGKMVTGAYSRDGKDWTEFLPDEVEWKGDVKVGVYVKHFTDAPFAVTFDEYTLITPKK
jgi:hypothetical protein